MIARGQTRLRVTGALVALAIALPARADESRFAVVDISGEPNTALVAEVEREVARLRPNAKPIDEPAMRRLLITAEGPAATAIRLSRASEAVRKTGNCDAALALAARAEPLILESVPLDEERELLKSHYTTLVTCEHQRGRTAERDRAARRLRDLVSVPPADLPTELWETVVSPATGPEPTIELVVDSEPANAQVQVNFHGLGVTPRTLKVAPGTVFVEVQKEGYLKGFRAIEVTTSPARAVFRLVDRTHDRHAQALSAMKAITRADPAQNQRTLSRLAQYARADTLVVLAVEDRRVRIRFFDAERGALSSEVIDSPFNPTTGRVAALASRSLAPAPTNNAFKMETGLPEAQAKQQHAIYRPTKKESNPWWSWAIAGGIAASLLTYIYLDQPRRNDTLAIRTFWNGPPAGR